MSQLVKERRLARIRVPNETHISDELEADIDIPSLPRFTLSRVERILVYRALEVGIAEPATTSFENNEALSFFENLVRIACRRVLRDRANGNLEHHVLTVSTMLVVVLTREATLGFELSIETVLGECR